MSAAFGVRDNRMSEEDGWKRVPAWSVVQAGIEEIKARAKGLLHISECG